MKQRPVDTALHVSGGHPPNCHYRRPQLWRAQITSGGQRAGAGPLILQFGQVARPWPEFDFEVGGSTRQEVSGLCVCRGGGGGGGGGGLMVGARARVRD